MPDSPKPRPEPSLLAEDLAKILNYFGRESGWLNPNALDLLAQLNFLMQYPEVRKTIRPDEPALPGINTLKGFFMKREAIQDHAERVEEAVEDLMAAITERMGYQPGELENFAKNALRGSHDPSLPDDEKSYAQRAKEARADAEGYNAEDSPTGEEHDPSASEAKPAYKSSLPKPTPFDPQR